MQVLYMEKASITLSFIFLSIMEAFHCFRHQMFSTILFFFNSKYQIFLSLKKPIKIYLIIFLLWEGGGGGAVN